MASEDPFHTVLQDIEASYTPAAPHFREDPPLDAILYINLDHRTDRRASIESVLNLVRPCAREVHRLSAVVHPNGAKGCALSHIKAFDWIASRPDWETVMIVEDDATLDMQPAQFRDTLREAVKVPFDVLVCGSEIWDHSLDKCKTACCPLTTAQCTTAYVVRRSYAPILRKLWQHCVDNTSNTRVRSEYVVFAIDQAWKRLMPLHRWRWFRGNPFRQYANYSDIEGREVEYKWAPRNLKPGTKLKGLH